MIGMASSLEQLRQRLALLPGVGPKMAERLAFYLLRASPKEVQDLIRTLEEPVPSPRVDFEPGAADTPREFAAGGERDERILGTVVYLDRHPELRQP